MPAFLYKWTELNTNKWYVGSRTGDGCHISDGYICSSKIVKPLIEEYPDNWTREVLVVGEPIYIRELETKYLFVLQSAQDSMSYNQSNGGSPRFHGLNRDPWNKGLKTGPHSEESNKKRSIALKGRKCGQVTEEMKVKISNTLKGNIPWNKGMKNPQEVTEETKKRLSIAAKADWIKRNLKRKETK